MRPIRVERTSPRAHVIVDDFFAPEELPAIFEEIASLDRHLARGLVREVGHDGQSVFFESPSRRNQAVWIHDPSKTLRLFRERLWSAPMLSWLEGAREPLFQIIPGCWSPNLQVSRYMTGDHYDFHEDEGAGVNLTVIVFLAQQPDEVRGGDLVLAYGGEQTKIRFRHNRLVIFPSKTLHRVTRVRVASTDPRHARISLQSWLAYGKPPVAESAKPRAQPAEADRPTFLLSEEPIIAAAQSMLSTSASSPQTPEELYWGAFYLSRILTQNLRWLAVEAGLALGEIAIRRVESEAGGEDLEVYGSARSEKSAPVRVGFTLRAGAPPTAAVRLFVERGRGRSTKREQDVLLSGAEPAETLALLRGLLRRAAEPAAR